LAFWGCTIPPLQPHVEKAVKLVCEKLGIELAEPEGMTCCPDPDISRMASEDYWLATAARNLALAERAGLDIMTPCNGCYLTFVDALHELGKERAKEKASEVLRELGLKLEGRVRVYHLVEVLHDHAGVDRISGEFVRKLEGARVAVHAGCKLLREEEKKLDSKFLRLVELTGVEVVEYGLERMCCGVPLMYLNPDVAVKTRTKPKLDRMKSAGVDAIVVVCPACYNQLEKGQLTLAAEGEEFGIPVVNVAELLALCMGYSPDDIGMYLHRIPVDSFLEKIGIS